MAPRERSSWADSLAPLRGLVELCPGIGIHQGRGIQIMGTRKLVNKILREEISRLEDDAYRYEMASKSPRYSLEKRTQYSGIADTKRREIRILEREIRHPKKER